MDNVGKNQRAAGLVPAQTDVNGCESVRTATRQRESPQIDAGVHPATRLGGALRRRTRYAWRRLTRGKRRPAAEAAFDWLLRQSIDDPGATAATIETLAACGAVDVARRRAAWLLSIQRPNGSLPTASMQTSSEFNTTQAVRGWLALKEEMPEVRPAITTAREYLSCPIDHTVATALPACEQAWWIEALIAAGDYEWAARAMQQFAAAQHRDGSVRTRPWISTAGLAHLTVCWYKLHRHVADARTRADLAMAYLVRRQRRDGGFRENAGRPATCDLHAEAVWTAKHFLDAALLQVRAAFDVGALPGEERSPQSDLPEQIDPADGRMEAVRQWFASLPADARVVDVGCGKGRFLRQLGREFPDARLTGIDVSPTMLAQLPEDVAAIEGGLLRIPAADGAFDAAFAVESLEHSLLPERAVAELCRIVRPGGRVLIIDKHAARQPLSEHEPWERWFTPEELTGWLARYCDEVSVESVSHTEGRGGVDLFLAATGQRREAS